MKYCGECGEGWCQVKDEDVGKRCPGKPWITIRIGLENGVVK